MSLTAAATAFRIVVASRSSSTNVSQASRSCGTGSRDGPVVEFLFIRAARESNNSSMPLTYVASSRCHRSKNVCACLAESAPCLSVSAQRVSPCPHSQWRPGDSRSKLGLPWPQRQLRSIGDGRRTGRSGGVSAGSTAQSVAQVSGSTKVVLRWWVGCGCGCGHECGGFAVQLAHTGKLAQGLLYG